MVSVHNFGEWSRAFIQLIMRWRIEMGITNYDKSGFYLKEHVNSPVVCFERLLVLGRANTHVKYFPSSEIAKSFKRFIYSNILSLPIDSLMSNEPQLVLNNSRRCNSLRSFRNNEYFDDDIDKYKQFSLESIRTLQKQSVHTVQLDPAQFGYDYRRVRVTWVLRSGASRRILNFLEIQRVILESGIVDVKWFQSHIVYMDNLSFREQVEIMSCTDILISVHGTALFNGILLTENSVVIQLFSPKFIEFVFSPPLRESGVYVINIPYVDHTQEKSTSDCDNIPQDCLNLSSTFAGNEIRCWAMRQCSFSVDPKQFHTKFIEAYYYILSARWL